MKILPPTNVNQVCSFVGMINYYKEHIFHCSELLSPLVTSLTKKNAKFSWSSDCQASFNQLKQLITKQVILTYPHFTKPFNIYTDASTKQIGAIIQQQDHLLAFYSCKLTNMQTRYTIIKLELLAIMETLQEYCTILLGHIIHIYTNHKNLTFLNFTTNHVHHWQLIVEEYDPEIMKNFPGTKNIVANFVSHQPFAEQSPNALNLLNELFATNDTDDNAFSLAFDVISSHQQADAKL